MKKFFPLWIAFHGLIVFSFLISLFFSPNIKFATSLFEILPPSSSLHEVQAADAKLAGKTGRAVTILVKSKSFTSAKKAAERLWSAYQTPSEFFDEFSLYVDSGMVAKITAYLHENRFVLLDDESHNLIESGNVSQLADDALMSVYSAFTLSDLSNLYEDPFLLSEKSLRSLLEGGAVASTAMSLRDDVLAAEKDGDFYVLLRGRVSERGAALASSKSTVKSLYKKMQELKADFSKETGEEEIDFIWSGVPFHSYESSSSAQTQISVISTVSLILIVLVFLWIFRSFLPAIVSALAVTLSCGIGFLSTLLFFRGIHVLTFVFGTTLIGTCLDYSIHYFVNWKNPKYKSGEEVRNHILRGITLGFVSTEICFAALFLAPFPLLKQVSVFLFTGLAAAYLSVVAFYPILPKSSPSKRHTNFATEKSSLFVGILHRFRLLPIICMSISILVILINYRSFKISNNIQELYSMSPKMLENEINSAKILNTGSSGWYFILKGSTEEEVLQKNEELDSYLKNCVLEGKLGSFLSVSQFIPSEKTQQANYSAAEKLLALVSQQYEALSLAESKIENQKLVTDYTNNYRSLSNHYVHISDKNLPETITEATANLWIGEVDGSYFSCVLPLHAKAEEEEFFREYAASNDGVFFVNKVKDISSQLDLLSKAMLLLLALAFIIVIGILFFFYKPKIVLKIAAIPLTVTLVTTAVLLLCKIHLSFFPITALVLVFGLGLDYIIYAIEGSDNTFAILLSFVTTALSFGALAISTFPPVHMLGLTVFVGLTTALLTAFCMTGRADDLSGESNI